jgi:tetratricopeptide (TPR) repeat protein
MSKYSLPLACAVALAACGHGDPAVVAKEAMKVCAKVNSDTKATIAACTTAISTGRLSEAEISDAYVDRAYAYLDLKDHKSALADLDALILRQPNNAKAFWLRGYVHTRLGHNDLAIADLERSIRLDGGSSSVFEFLGDAYRAKRDFDQAEVSYGHAIDMSKGDIYAWRHRCLTRAIIGKDFEAALADCNQAMKLTSKDPDSLAWVLSDRGFAQYRMKRYREAIQDCDAAIAHGATIAGPFYVRGLAKRALGDASASDDIDIANKIAPEIAQKTYAAYGVPETP